MKHHETAPNYPSILLSSRQTLCLFPSFSMMGVLNCFSFSVRDIHQLPSKQWSKTLVSFHYTGWLRIGILMTAYSQYNCGVLHPKKITQRTGGFTDHCSVASFLLFVSASSISMSFPNFGMHQDAGSWKTFKVPKNRNLWIIKFQFHQNWRVHHFETVTYTNMDAWRLLF